MRQGVTRAETPRDRREREALDEDMRGNPLAGEPIRRRLRNFRPDADAQLAALGGPLAWMRRLRAIEIAVDLHEQQLAEARDELRDGYAGDPERFAGWHELAEHWDFGEVNDLIERHNRHLPGRVAPADEPAHRRLRAGERPPVHARAARRGLDSGSFPADGQT